MKKQLVIIVGNCYPIASANGNLALKCAQYLKKDYNIRIIAVKQSSSNAVDFDMGDNIKLYTSGRFRLDWYNKHRRLYFASQGIMKKLYNASCFLARVLGKIDSTFFHIDNMWWYRNSAYKLLEKLNSEEKIDTIISFCMPIESHLAAMMFKQKHNDILWASYWADDFAVKSNKKNIFISLKKLKKIESDILDKSDVIFSTEEISCFLRKYLNKNQDRLIPVPYTICASKANKTSIKCNNSNVTCVYMGTLYKNIRNPEFLLKTFSDPLLKDIRLLLYIRGDCNDIVEKYERNNSNIMVSDFIPKKQLEKVINDSDILINIDNVNCNGKPSKLYELISYRKPIINFSFNEDLGDLSNYPSKLQISMQGNTHDAANEVRKFISSEAFSNLVINAEQIEQLYYHHTENYVCELINKSLQN